MRNLNKLFLKSIFFLKERAIFFSFIASLVSLLLVLFKLINLNIIGGFSKVPTLNLLFNTLVLLSTIYCMLFLPSYPIFFILCRKKDFNFLEKLSLTLVINLSYYILLGYIDFFITNEITGIFIYFSTTITFLSIIICILLVEIKTKRYKLFKSYKISFSMDFTKDNFSLLNLIKSKVHLNGFLLIIFLILNCILNIVRFEYFYGTDPWLHISIIKMISEMNFLPLNEYYGSLGFHIFSSILHFFSGVNIILIPKYFTFYTISLSALVFYILLMKIFKNKDLAIFGVFILEFSYLGFNYMMYQYWPSSLVLIQGLFIFYLLYRRLLNFVKLNRPTKNLIFKDISFYYPVIIIVFISATFTHSLTIILLLISFMWIFFIYFIKDIKRGIDFILLCILFMIFITLYLLGFGSEHYWFLDDITIYWKELIFLVFISALPLILLVWRIKKSILFTTGRFEATLTGERSNYYKRIEDQFIIPIAFIIVILIAIVFFIGNFLLFELSVTTIFVIIELFFLIVFGLWGIILFQKTPKGKIFLIWGLSLIIILVAGFLFDLIFERRMYFVRIFYMSAPVIAIGFVSYVYKLIKVNKITVKKIKLFFMIFITFSLFSSYIHEFFTVQDVSLKKQEVSCIKWFADNNNKRSVIITEFGFNYIFIYFDYPYDINNQELQGDKIHFFLKHYVNLFPPENHFNKSGYNILQNLKNQYNSDVYITLDNLYYLNVEWELYGRLTQEQIEKYYSLSYINKIYSAKSEFGGENPLYWVI